MTISLYLAHLNPLTKAHESIISFLQKSYDVYVYPVRFLRNNLEVNTKSFPFSFEIRKEMVNAIFGDKVHVFPDYTFYAPFVKYMPPLLSPKSWDLRNQILSRLGDEKFVSYTGDKAEQIMLKAYRLNPLKADRLEISASSVKEMLYEEALTGNKGDWRNMVPDQVVKIIERNWDTIEKFARSEDTTTRVMGMKFPKEGYR